MQLHREVRKRACRCSVAFGIVLAAVCAVFAGAIPDTAYAMPAREVPVTYAQPDGSTFEAVKRGDEFFSFTQTEDGALIQRDPKDASWRYVVGSGDDLALGERVAAAAPRNAAAPASLATEAAKSAYAKLGGGAYAGDGRARLRGSQEVVTLDDIQGVQGSVNALDAEGETSQTSLPLVPIVVGFGKGNAPSEVIEGPDGATWTQAEQTYSSDFDWHEHIFTGERSIGTYYSTMSEGAFTWAPVTGETSAYGEDGNTNKADKAGDGIIHVTLERDHGNWNRIEEEGSPADYRSMCKEALSEASKYYDFSQLDVNGNGVIDPEEGCVLFIIAGYEASAAPDGTAPILWAHQGELSLYDDDDPNPVPVGESGVAVNKMITMGETLVFDEDAAGQPMIVGCVAHELGHYLGLPDYYDVYYTADSDPKPSYDDYPWMDYDTYATSLMGGGSWGSYYTEDGTEVFSPVALDAVSLVSLGYVEPVEVKADGSYTATSRESDAGYRCFLIKSSVDDEYYLVENRQFAGFDRGLEYQYCRQDEVDKPWYYNSTGGLIVWHVDKSILADRLEMNEVNTVDHRPGIMPVYTPYEYDGKTYSMAKAKYRPFYTAGAMKLFGKTELDLPLYDGAKTPADCKASGVKLSAVPEGSGSMTFSVDVPEPAPSTEGTLKIAHTNDIHGTAEVGYWASEDATEKTYVNMFSKMKSMIGEEGAQLVLDAGDTFHGDSFATVTGGKSIAALLKAVGYDATTPGNHDWSYGWRQLQTLSGNAASDGADSFILAANVHTADGSEGGCPFAPAVTREVSLDGRTTIKVGIVGVIDPGLYGSTSQKSLEGLAPFGDAAAAANAWAANLRDEMGCDLVICLTHTNDPAGFAAKTRGIDAVIAGHEHLMIDRTTASEAGAATNAEGKPVAIVENASQFSAVGLLSLDVKQDADGAWAVVASREQQFTPQQLDEGYQDDEGVLAVYNEQKAAVDKKLDEVIGTAQSDYPYPSYLDAEKFTPGGWELVRTEDSAIGHVVTAAYLNETGADLAIENAGGIGGGIAKGDVTYGDLVDISSYGNTLATYTMKGSDIRAMINTSLDIQASNRAALDEQMAALKAYKAEHPDATYDNDPAYANLIGHYPAWADNSGNTLSIGGAELEVSWSMPDGKHLLSATIDGKPLDDDATYTVAMSSYMPGCADYDLGTTATLKTEYGTCEESLRKFVGTAGWEGMIAGLVGTVSYVNAVPATPLTPATPVKKPTDITPATPVEETESSPDAKEPEGDLPQTGDLALVMSGFAALTGTGIAGTGAFVAHRRCRRRRVPSVHRRVGR